jgi:YD repeat-containing protein
MNKHFFYFALIACQLSGISFGKAQVKSGGGTLPAPPANLVIDGDIKEWGDSLRFYNAEKKMNYSLANDQNNLYMAIRINDRLDQMKILRAGLTFSIDPKGKKKDAFSITFPLTVQGSTALTAIKENMDETTEQERQDLMREQLTTLRGIKVEGFKDIEGDMITTSNTYGIQTAINYDQNGNLVCETAIPLKFFHVDNPAKNEWAFNFKINGIARPRPENANGEQVERPGRRGGGMGDMGGGRGGRGGRGGGSRVQSLHPPDTGEMGRSEDFWKKFYLAK